MANLSKVLLPETEESRAVEFRVAADVVVRVRVELFPVFVAPDFLRLILAVHVNGPGAPVLLLARHEVPTLEDQDPLPRRGERPEQSSAARPRSDDDRVIVTVRAHESLLAAAWPQA